MNTDVSLGVAKDLAMKENISHLTHSKKDMKDFIQGSVNQQTKSLDFNKRVCKSYRFCTKSWSDRRRENSSYG